jgi:hypothetical protein
MRKVPPPASPDAYVAAIRGWRRELVELLRAAARKSKVFEEQIKWGHLVYSANGPAGLIRAEKERVLFGFWRGKRLVALEPRLKPGGKYEMATLDFREGDTITAAKAARLMREAAALNHTVGDPTRVSPRPRKAAPSAPGKKAARKRPART